VESTEKRESRGLCQPGARLGESDRETMVVARCDGGRSSRYAVDGVGRRRLAVSVATPADDDGRARLDRAAVFAVS